MGWGIERDGRKAQAKCDTLRQFTFVDYLNLPWLAPVYIFRWWSSHHADTRLHFGSCPLRVPRPSTQLTLSS